MDFKGLGQVDKAFVPLLEEACSHHPSLVDDDALLIILHLLMMRACFL
jgi:hypothetical protein